VLIKKLKSMLLIISSVILLVLCIFLAYKFEDENEALSPIAFFVGMIDFVFLIGAMFCIQWEIKVKNKTIEYTELKSAVEQSSEQKELLEKVYEMNADIEKNKSNHNSLWVGWFYSEEIGNLEKINYIK
jgi:hypothetical protein